MECLTDLVVDGKPPQSEWGLPNNIRTVPATSWLEELKRRGILDKDASNPSSRWSELKTGLMAKKQIGEWDGHVWKIS